MTQVTSRRQTRRFCYRLLTLSTVWEQVIDRFSLFRRDACSMSCLVYTWALHASFETPLYRSSATKHFVCENAFPSTSSGRLNFKTGLFAAVNLFPAVMFRTCAIRIFSSTSPFPSSSYNIQTIIRVPFCTSVIHVGLSNMNTLWLVIWFKDRFSFAHCT